LGRKVAYFSLRNGLEEQQVDSTGFIGGRGGGTAWLYGCLLTLRILIAIIDINIMLVRIT
jgi:hypothetical protein